VEEMNSTPSQMADAIIAWFERFELNHLRSEEQAFLVDELILEMSQRADRARRRGEWDIALRDCRLALIGATDQPRRAGQDESKAEKRAIYSEAVARLYTGAVLLARSDSSEVDKARDLETALSHLEPSVEGFGHAGRRRAESIAWAAIGMVNALRHRWPDALKAWQESVAVDDGVVPVGSSLHELRRQFVHVFRGIVDYYEREAQPIPCALVPKESSMRPCAGEERDG
jgi:hypothetical protein